MLHVDVAGKHGNRERDQKVTYQRDRVSLGSALLHLFDLLFTVAVSVDPWLGEQEG
jgi:hypothetical protein